MGFNCLKARATSRRQFTFYNKTIYQSMCAFTGKMINLNKPKKGWTKFAKKSSWNKKMLKNQQFSIFHFKTCSCLGYSYILTSTLLMNCLFFKHTRTSSTCKISYNLISYFIYYYLSFLDTELKSLVVQSCVNLSVTSCQVFA